MALTESRTATATPIESGEMWARDAAGGSAASTVD
jgi:hypothetical protein